MQRGKVKKKDEARRTRKPSQGHGTTTGSNLFCPKLRLLSKNLTHGWKYLLCRNAWKYSSCKKRWPKKSDVWQVEQWGVLTCFWHVCSLPLHNLSLHGWHSLTTTLTWQIHWAWCQRGCFNMSSWGLLEVKYVFVVDTRFTYHENEKKWGWLYRGNSNKNNPVGTSKRCHLCHLALQSRGAKDERPS